MMGGPVMKSWPHSSCPVASDVLPKKKNLPEPRLTTHLQQGVVVSRQNTHGGSQQIPIISSAPLLSDMCLRFPGPAEPLHSTHPSIPCTHHQGHPEPPGQASWR